MRSSIRRLSLAAIACLAGAGSVSAQQQDFSAVEITTTKLSPTLYMLVGEGGNIGVSAGPDGVYLIDDQYAPLSEKILSAVKAISDKPVRYVVNTHWHGDHTGGNENMGKAGATIIAHDAVRTRMARGQEMPLFKNVVPPAPPAALPVVTFSDKASLHLNGETANLIHVAPAHTDGDVIIHWPASNVIHMGDTFFNGIFPFIDAGSGGKLSGMIEAVETVLALAGDETKIIPGHGPLADRGDLTRFHEMLLTVRERAMAAKSAGQTAEEWAASNPFADLESEWGKGFLKAPLFAKVVYSAL